MLRKVTRSPSRHRANDVPQYPGTNGARGRWHDGSFHTFEDCRANINKPPSEYLKRFWLDTVNFDPRCLELAIDFAGASQILAGSDYPHLIGSLEMMLSSIGEVDISDENRAAILGGNTKKLLGLES